MGKNEKSHFFKKITKSKKHIRKQQKIYITVILKNRKKPQFKTNKHYNNYYF